METFRVFCALLSVEETVSLVFDLGAVEEDPNLLVGMREGVPSSLTNDMVDPCLEGVPWRLTGRDPPGVTLALIGIEVLRDDSGVLRSLNVLSLSESVRVFDERSLDCWGCCKSEVSLCILVWFVRGEQ